MGIKQLGRKYLVRKYKLTVGKESKTYYEGFTDCLRFMDKKIKILKNHVEILEKARESDLNTLNKKMR